MPSANLRAFENQLSIRLRPQPQKTDRSSSRGTSITVIATTVFLPPIVPT